MNGTPNRLAMIEALEDRRLLCGTTSTTVASVGAALHTAVTPAAVRAPLEAKAAAVKVVKAKPKKIVATTSPSLVQDYKGTMRGRGAFGQGVFSTTFELNITAQTLKNVTGRLIVNGHGAGGVLKGQLLSNGKFTYRLAAKGVIIGITGTVRPDGSVITGTASLQILVGSKFRLAGTYAAKAVSAT